MSASLTALRAGLGALDRVAPQRAGRAAFKLWLRLPDGIDVDQLAQHCESAGLLIAPGTEWFPAEPAAPYVRLNYSGPNPADFPRAVRILAAQVDRSRA